ncbi:MAG: type II toxin-antitoxin system VapB family antitoxin [Melioribacteraceae bacterium]
METAKLFKNGKSQAVRLPKAYRFKGNEVMITKVGDAVVLYPKKVKWDLLINSLDKFSVDFLTNRNQTNPDKREEIFV